MNKSDPLAQLETYDAAGFQRWLVDGVKRMNGYGGPMVDAFAPVDHLVGHTRERTWIDDLARGIYPELSQGAGHRLCAGIDGGIAELASEPMDSSWLPLTQLLELMRLLQPEQRCSGIDALSNALERAESALAVDQRVHLTSQALLALLEARGAERVAARPLALRLTRLLLDTRTDMSTAQKAALGKRLKRLPGVENETLTALGLVVEPAPVSPAAQRLYQRAPAPAQEQAYEASDA